MQHNRLLDVVLLTSTGCVTSGMLPATLLLGHPDCVRAVNAIEVPGQHQLFMRGCDISRNWFGSFLVNADWMQAPSGAGCALADRQVVAYAAPDRYERVGLCPA